MSEFNIPSVSPDVIPAEPSKQLRVALKWVAAATAKNMEDILATISDEQFEHHLLPEYFTKAMGFQLVRNGKQELAEGLGRILGLLKTPSVSLLNLLCLEYSSTHEL